MCSCYTTKAYQKKNVTPKPTWNQIPCNAHPHQDKNDHEILGQEDGIDTIPDACQIMVKDSTLVIR